MPKKFLTALITVVLMFAFVPAGALAATGEAKGSTPAVKAHEHVWSAWKTTKAATVFKAGTQERACKKCDQVQVKKTVKLKAYAKISKKAVSLKVGKSKKLSVKFAKGDKVASWKSSKKSVASVMKSGKVKAQKAGKTIITVKLKSGKTAKCKVTVKKKPSTKSSASSSSNATAGTGTVYWTPSGSVYHASRDCPTLGRSKTVKSGSVFASHKSRVCKVCG